MGQIVPLALPTQSGATKTGQEGSARLVNCYAEAIPQTEGKTAYSLYGCPGLDSYVTVSGATNVRAMLSTSDGLIAVVGRQVVRIRAGGSQSTVGGIGADGPVFMAENRAGQVGIVCDGQYHVYDNGTVTRVQDPDLPPPISMAEIAGYFVFAIADGTFYYTEVDDALTISALDFASAESKPDGNVANANLNNQLVTFGERTTEFHSLSADADAPFTRATAINVGCWARGSVAEILYTADRQATGTTLMFAATDAKGSYAGVMMLNGYTPLKLSTKYVDRIVAAESDPGNIRSFAWTFEGHSFYCITGTAFSLVYDASEGLWHDRATWGKAYWQMASHAHFDGLNLFGSRDSGIIYQENADSYSEGSDPIQMTIQFPPLTVWQGTVIVNAVHVDATTGVGLTTTDPENLDPVMMLDFSDDGGVHWSVPREMALGRKAQTNTDVKAYRFGRVPNTRTFRLRCQADVLKAVHQAQADITVLR